MRKPNYSTIQKLHDVTASKTQFPEGEHKPQNTYLNGKYTLILLSLVSLCASMWDIIHHTKTSPFYYRISPIPFIEWSIID